MGKRLAGIIHVTICLIIQQHNGSCLRKSLDLFGQVRKPVLKNPIVRRQINLMTGSQISYQLTLIQVTYTSSMGTGCPLEILHRAIAQTIIINTLTTLKCLQPLPDSFNTGCSLPGHSRNRNTTVWVKRRELQIITILTIRCHINNNTSRILLHQSLHLLSLISNYNHTHITLYPMTF